MPIQLLCTLNDLKAALGLAAEEASDDAKLTELIAIASVQIASHCKRSFEVVEIADELHDGDGTSVLEVDVTPIVSVSALSIDGQAVDPKELAVYPNLVAFKESGDWNPRLRSYGAIFPEGRQNVKLTYRAGYAAVPADIVKACVIQAIFLQNTLHKQGIISETNQVAQATTQYSEKDLAPPVRVVANRYRKSRLKAI